MGNEFQEFAEEYSVRERVRVLVRGLVIGGVFILLWKLWLLPAFAEFTASAHCRSVFGMRGAAALWYGLFVGYPLFLALLLAFMQGRYGLRILRDGQSPPIGVKVLRTTRIRRGAFARRIGYLHLFAFTPLLGIAAWGYFQARSLSELSKHRDSSCTTKPFGQMDRGGEYTVTCCIAWQQPLT